MKKTGILMAAGVLCLAVFPAGANSFTGDLKAGFARVGSLAAKAFRSRGRADSQASARAVQQAQLRADDLAAAACDGDTDDSGELAGMVEACANSMECSAGIDVWASLGSDFAYNPGNRCEAQWRQFVIDSLAYIASWDRVKTTYPQQVPDYIDNIASAKPYVDNEMFPDIRCKKGEYCMAKAATVMLLGAYRPYDMTIPPSQGLMCDPAQSRYVRARLQGMYAAEKDGRMRKMFKKALRTADREAKDGPWCTPLPPVSR